MQIIWPTYCGGLIDGSYGVHWDPKGHTGAMISMDKGAIVNVSWKHKFIVGSLIKSELVRIVGVLRVMMWCTPWKHRVT